MDRDYYTTFIARSPQKLVSTIPPFEIEAIAQSTDTKTVVQSDPRIPNQLPSDLPSLLLTAVLSGSAVWIGLAKFGARLGDDILAKKQLESELVKSQAEINLSEDRAKLDQTKELFNLILDTLKEERKTTKGILDILLAKYLSSNSEMADSVTTQQILLQGLIEKLGYQEKNLESISKNINDIFKVLEIKARGDRS